MKFLVSFLCLGLFVLAQAQAPIKLSNIVRIKDKIPEGNTNAIAVDPRIGLVYVAGQGHISIHAQNERLALLPHQLITGERQNGPNDKVVICPIGNTIWVGDKTGLGSFKLSDLGEKPYKPHLQNTKITGIVPWKKDTVLVLSQDKLMLIPGKIQLSKKSYKDLVKVAGNIYVASHDSIFYWDVKEKKFAFAKKRRYPKLVNIFNAGEQLAVVTQDSLFLREKGKEILKQALPTKQKISSVKTLEAEKALYIATFDGLFKINEEKNQYDTIDLRTIDNIPLKIILSLEISNDNLLIGTRAGGVHIYSPQRSKTFIPFHLTYEDAKELHDYAIRSFAPDPQNHNRYYFGNDRGQVFRATYDASGKIIETPRLINLGKPWLQIRSIFTYNDQVIVGTGTDTARVYFYNNKGVEITGPMTFPEATVISSFYVLHDSLYIGTDAGLFRLDLALKQKVKPKDPIDLSEIKNITDTGWLCSKGKIGKITKQGTIKWYHFKAKDQDFQELDVLHLAPIDRDHVYLFNREFLQRARIENDSIVIEKKYDESNGLVGFDNAKANIIYGGFLDRNGNLWISSNYGLYCKVKGQDYFARFTPPILGLPDNVDANTGSFLKLNDSMLLFGFRHGGVVVNTIEYDAFRPIKMVLLEKQDDKFIRILESGSKIKKNNFNGISNVFPFNLDLIYGGDQPILIENKSGGSTVAIQVGQAKLITPRNPLFSSDELYFSPLAYRMKKKVLVQYVGWVWLGAFFLLVIVIIVALLYRKNRQKKAEIKKKDIARLELEAISTLANKALGEHFLRNNLSEIIKQETVSEEIRRQPLLRSILSSIPVEGVEQIITTIETDMKDGAGRAKYVPEHIEKAVEGSLQDLPKQKQLLLNYANFFKGIWKDKTESAQIRRDIEGYYSKLVKTGVEHSIFDDAEFIKGLIKLYQLNPKYDLKVELPDQAYSSGSIKIDAQQEEFKKAMIPRMLVQPLVENARKYGKKPCEIEVVYKQEVIAGEQWANISVTNNGSWSDTSPDKQLPSASTSTRERSLSIIEKELERRGGSLSRKETGSNVCVEIRIPIHIQNLEA
ncbi:MAG: hypothetical protein SFV55_01510 [Haliscomenobacter sp.]|uniref:hypothetical protein n=1 Tax=Haliscomenobacter sp. TaxID=2717303 RepID=UPI0029A42979|nr:hypothetical protein [Haliscomenobacter sp.]MDX2067067.1 hypothetical protein [Haliscomenobacter sp.]